MSPLNFFSFPPNEPFLYTKSYTQPKEMTHKSGQTLKITLEAGHGGACL